MSRSAIPLSPRLTLLTLLAVLSRGCGAQSLNDVSLYARIGGTATVTAVVGDVIDEAARDPHLQRSFANTDLSRIKRLLIEQICALSGGGCTYSGDSMREVHAGLGITQLCVAWVQIGIIQMAVENALLQTARYSHMHDTTVEASPLRGSGLTTARSKDRLRKVDL